MIRDLLTQTLWPLLVLWGLVYLADYYATIYVARLMRSTSQEYICFEGGVELTPIFRKDVNALRWFSPTFLRHWLLSFPLLALFWWLWTVYLDLPQGFYVVIGGLLLGEAAILLRHSRNLALAYLCRTAGSLRGHLEYSRWLGLRLSAVELFGFAALFGLIAVGMESWFFLGGALMCAMTGYRHWAYSRKEALLPAEPVAVPADFEKKLEIASETVAAPDRPGDTKR